MMVPVLIKRQTFQTFLVLLNVFNWIESQTSIVQLNVLIRHGERTPTDFYTNDPYAQYNWTDGVGHLTKKGKLQMYELGKIFREQYKDFIPSYYFPEDVNVTSSYSERCRNSAYLFCAGLYPPKDIQVWNSDLLWQPVPLTYIPRSEDTIIVMKAKCDKYDKLFSDINNSTKVREIVDQHRNLFIYLSKYAGDNVQTLEDVEFIYNTLEIEQLHNLTLPDWVNDTILAEMRELGAINLALYSDTRYMKRMKGGMFLKTIFSSMDKALAREKTKKINLYVGHDLTIVHVLRALNLRETIKPGFGAYLLFELHSDDRLRIMYSDSTKGPTEIDRIYDFKTLKDTTSPVIPNDYETECRLDNI